MPEKVSISDSEWKLMKLLWQRSPQPAYDLSQVLAGTEGWDARTVKTLLARLVKKRALATEPYKNLYLYRPLIAEDEAIRPKLRHFLDQVFDGSVSNLLVHFSKHRKLSKEELSQIKRIIDQMED